MQAEVGCRSLVALDPVQQAEIPIRVLYPTAEPPVPLSIGPYPLELAIDAAPLHPPWPLLVFSHGNGGSPWTNRGLAMHLVRQGFAMVMLEHPGNNRRDNSLGSPDGLMTVALLQHRPRHVRLAVDAVRDDPWLGPLLRPRLAQEGYAMIGESIGGYTALAVAGGRARTVPDEVDLDRRRQADAELAKLSFAIETEADPRLRAAVLLSPAIGFFMADGALAEVDIPLLVRTGALDRLCPRDQVALTLRSVPDPARVDLRDVANAGHFSFQTPFPPALAHIPPAQDPPGFDRAGYQLVLCADVTAFLRARYTAGPHDRLDRRAPADHPRRA